MITKQGKATKPLRLPNKAPACFESQAQWNSYRPLAVSTAINGWTYCTDCTLEHQHEMRRQGRCRYPKTVFRKLPSGIIIGGRRK